MTISPGPTQLHLFSFCLLIGNALAPAAQTPSPSHGAQTLITQGKYVHQQCSFANGSTITLGAEVLDRHDIHENGYRTGEYTAVPFRVSDRMVLPPLGDPIEIPPGTYTLFVTDQTKSPVTIIISKKSGPWGMPYPGREYDLGRTSSGTDFNESLTGSSIGCWQATGGPIMLWIQSDHRLAYAKILAEKSVGGKTEYLFR